MDRPYRTWMATTPRQTALEIAKGMASPPLILPPETIEPSREHYRGRIVLLADRHTAPAAEDFLIPFKDNGRGVLVGETTRGSGGQPFYQDLGAGMRLWVNAKRPYIPGGAEFEGVGIAPEVAVEVASEDVEIGRAGQ